MSVLYKALQKAEKENEARQSASSDGFDPRRLAASGALKAGGSRGRAASRIALAGILLVGVAASGAFLMFQDQFVAPAPQPALPVVEANAPAPAVAEAAPAPASPEAAPVQAAPTQAAPVQLAGNAPAPPPGAPAATAPADAAATPVAAASPAASAQAEAAPAPPAETQVAAAPVAANPTAKPAAPARAAAPPPQRPEPMPTISPDSPARMLSPPIAINRAEFALAGVGNQVQVREVSQAARSNAAAGYDALVRGSYDTALGFYEAALKDEPSSVLALLGRGTALQKLGRGGDAQGAYDQVLKLDPQNREALANLTAIVAERSPQEALARLQELEREYPSFSPIKAQIGLAYARSGAMQPALEYLRRAIALSPSATLYHYNLALVQDHLGQREQAIASYERVLDFMAGGASSDASRTEIERRVRFLRAR